MCLETVGHVLMNGISFNVYHMIMCHKLYETSVVAMKGVMMVVEGRWVMSCGLLNESAFLLMILASLPVTV